MKKAEQIRDYIANYQRTKSQRHVPAPVPQASSVSGQIEDLKKLSELKDSGIITQEEFEAKKKQILGL
ncbi:SHOCT domain-containing protein [Paenibacillus sp. TH7-28]